MILTLCGSPPCDVHVIDGYSELALFQYCYDTQAVVMEGDPTLEATVLLF